MLRRMFTLSPRKGALARLAVPTPAGQPTVDSVMAAWLASTGHLRQPDNRRLPRHRTGLRQRHANNSYRTYWTMTLGAAR